MTRIAQCCCGSLKAEARAEPWRVIVCHCVECQRRTGSAFGVGAYFRIEDVEVSGPNTTFARKGTTGQNVEAHFCPTCGATVYWFTEMFAGIIGVSLGAFSDKDLPAPALSAWEGSGHGWVKLEGEMIHLPRGRDG